LISLVTENKNEFLPLEDVLIRRSHRFKGFEAGVVIHSGIERKKLCKGTGKTIAGIKHYIMLAGCFRINIYCLT
jgi:hypothetical protein